MLLRSTDTYNIDTFPRAVGSVVLLLKGTLLIRLAVSRQLSPSVCILWVLLPDGRIGEVIMLYTEEVPP
jgi:hypothetical protein